MVTHPLTTEPFERMNHKGPPASQPEKSAVEIPFQSLTPHTHQWRQQHTYLLVSHRVDHLVQHFGTKGQHSDGHSPHRRLD